MSEINETEQVITLPEKAEFHQLVKTHSRTVFNISYAILGDRGTAEEVSQDVFLQIWQRLETFKRQSSFSTWLYAITRNAAISYRRKLRSRGMLRTSDQNQVLESGGVPDEEQSRDFLEERLLAKAIAELPPDMQTVIRLYYLEEQSVDRVAEMLRMPSGTVKTLLYRARLRLHRGLEKHRMEN